jgi:cyclase
VRHGQVVKGVRFRDAVVVGAIEALARRYADEGADEIVLYDIAASVEERCVAAGWIARVAALVDVPFCVAGGIRSVADARRALAAGADKVSVNTPALERPALIDELADAFGSQCVVVGIDSLCDADGAWRPRRRTGDPDAMRACGRTTLEWVAEVQHRGAGEVVLNCMAADGVRAGFDLVQLRAVREACRVPLVASGGAGRVEHFADAFLHADVDATLAASVFHSGQIAIPELKASLRRRNIEVRDVDPGR